MRFSAHRYLRTALFNDIADKLIILSGPRQAGKTTLCKSLGVDHVYLNYDLDEHRKQIRGRNWNRACEYLILAELHKMPKWKTWLKGLTDDPALKQKIIVSGSARLDTWRKSGDSLAGRFFGYRLHPFDIKEICREFPDRDVEKILDGMLTHGNFPEPYLKGTSQFYNKWRRSHIDIILRQDLLDLEQVRDLKGIELLIDLLRERIGLPLSANSLAHDLRKDNKTIERWLTILENLFVVFRIRPYHRNLTKVLVKAPKLYFFDTAKVMGDEGAKLENLVACALLKEIDYCNDAIGIELSLHYIRKKSGEEVDFLITKDRKPWRLIEVKHGDSNFSPHLLKFAEFLGLKGGIQLVRQAERERTIPGEFQVLRTANWLKSFDFSS